MVVQLIFLFGLGLCLEADLLTPDRPLCNKLSVFVLLCLWNVSVVLKLTVETSK